jgi:hypothetical protein
MNQSKFAHALPVIQAVLPHMRRQRGPLIALGSLARAAGASGDREAFEEAWTEVWALIRVDAQQMGAALALLDLARGAASLGEWERAERAVHRGMEIAKQRSEAQPQLLAESIRGAIRHRRFDHKDVEPHSEATPTTEADALAEELVTSLEQAITGSTVSVV